MTRIDAEVIVVGAGLSGLTTAFHLARRGRQVAVIEAAQRPGGVIGSQRREGVLYELGPNSGLDTTPLIDELLGAAGIRDERLDASAAAARRYILRGGALVAMPTSPGAFFGTRLFSWRAKLALLREPFVAPAPAGAEDSVADFVRRRLGTEFLDYAIEPFVAGIYAGDPQMLSVPSAFPRLAALQQRYGSLIGGQILGARERSKSAEKAKNMAVSFSFRDGMQTLTDALARALPIECGVQVVAVRRDADGFALDCERGRAGSKQCFERRARAVVIAVPAYAAARIVAPLDDDAARALTAIDYPPVAVVASAYRRSDVVHPLDGFGFLAPKKEDPPILGSLFSSTMFAHRAPEGTVLLTTFVGGRRNPELALAAEGEIAAAVQAALARYVGAAAALWSVVTRWPQAIPQYTLGHRERIAAVERAEAAAPGLYFCANWRGGVSVGDCIKSGHAMAERIDRALAAHWARSSATTSIAAGAPA
ncbi:MAG: protoporphyrinogen oxidase [Burkholderiaceae bacterium]